jgi:hypothetical protein
LGQVIVTWVNSVGPNTAGHIVVSVNGGPNQGFDTANWFWDPFAATGETVPGAVKSIDLSRRTTWDQVTIPTSHDQDVAIKNFIDHRSKKPGFYNLAGRNCTEFVRDALGAGGIGLGTCVKPSCLIRELTTKFPK